MIHLNSITELKWNNSNISNLFSKAIRLYPASKKKVVPTIAEKHYLHNKPSPSKEEQKSPNSTEAIDLSYKSKIKISLKKVMFPSKPNYKANIMTSKRSKAKISSEVKTYWEPD